MQEEQETPERVIGPARRLLDGTGRAARHGLRLAKDRARRRDRVGEATYRALELVSDGLGGASRALRELGEAMRPPARSRTRKTA